MFMAKGGAQLWYFPDGYLPEKKPGGALESHEALMVLNTQDKPASITMDIYFEERSKKQTVTFEVAPETVKTLRMDNPDDLGGISIPFLTQYALRVSSDLGVVVQFGRLDATQENLAYYGTMGFCE